jgi:very-short-patch-repair endonuclease
MMRSYRLAHPSPNEVQMMEILNGLGVVYQREAQVLGEEILVSVDFYLPDLDRVIEVLGQVHFDPRFDHPRKLQTRRELDALRRAKLEKAGLKVLEVDWQLMSEPARARYRVVEFLEGLFPGK